MLAEKLRLLGIKTHGDLIRALADDGSENEKTIRARTEYEKMPYVEAVSLKVKNCGGVVWLQIEERETLAKVKELNICLARWWEGLSRSELDLGTLRCQGLSFGI